MIRSVSSLSASSIPSLSHKELYQSTLREYYSHNPVEWVSHRLGEFVWSKQAEILNSVRDNRRTAVYSCHRVGKSWSGGRIAFWWLDTHKPGDALVVTSAHSSTQVKMALWREMGRVHAKGKFPGRMNQVEYWMPIIVSNEPEREEMVAFGRKPSDTDPSAFQGTYAPYVLFIMDEGCYVAESLWDGAETLISNDNSRIVAYGNPDDPDTEFGRVCSPGSGWNRIQIGYADTPNFTNEPVPSHIKSMLIGPTWVEEKRRKWGEDNPLYISKVLGQFPEVSGDDMTLIPMRYIKEAQERTLESIGDNELGVDVGGGGNKNVIAHRHGPVVRIIKQDHNPDTMGTLSNVLDQLEVTGADRAKIDNIGIGHGAADRAAEMASDQALRRSSPSLAQRAAKVVPITVSEPANDTEHFINLRAEGYWTLRERFYDGLIDIDPDDEDLAAQLVAIRYKRSAGRIQIESKEEMRHRRVASPDKADAVMLAFLKEKEKKKYRLTWGRRRQ